MLSNRIVYKGWDAQMERVQQGIEMLISGTPTSRTRNLLTDINIKLFEIRKAKRKEFNT